MPVTIRDVAKRAHVSVSTVSVVVNGGKYVSPELRERVETAIRDLNYTPSPLGRALSLRRTSTLAYMIPTIANPFFPAIIQAVQNAAFDHGYGLIVCSMEEAKERAQQYQAFLQNTHVDGVLVSFTSRLPMEMQFDTFARRSIPVVRLAGPRPEEPVDCVVTSDDYGMERLTDYLLKLGHRRIAFIGRQSSQGTEARLTGIRKALHLAGLELPSEYIRYVYGYASPDVEAATRSLMSMPERPTALLTYNDSFAAWIIHACNGLGLRIPQDVTVTGYDDTLLSIYTSPELTTMHVPAEEMGRLAIELLIQRITGTGPAEPQIHAFTPELVIRGSSGPPPK